MTHMISQATLLGNLRGQELETMVSTSELQKTKGTVRTLEYKLNSFNSSCCIFSVSVRTDHIHAAAIFIRHQP